MNVSMDVLRGMRGRPNARTHASIPIPLKTAASLIVCRCRWRKTSFSVAPLIHASCQSGVRCTSNTLCCSHPYSCTYRCVTVCARVCIRTCYVYIGFCHRISFRYRFFLFVFFSLGLPWLSLAQFSNLQSKARFTSVQWLCEYYRSQHGVFICVACVACENSEIPCANARRPKEKTHFAHETLQSTSHISNEKTQFYADFGDA